MSKIIHNPNSELYQVLMLCPHKYSGFDLRGSYKLHLVKHFIIDTLEKNFCYACPLSDVLLYSHCVHILMKLSLLYFYFSRELLLGISSNVHLKNLELNISGNDFGVTGSLNIESTIADINNIASLDISNNS